MQGDGEYAHVETEEWTGHTLTCMLKMQAILIAQRMPSRHREATSWSSQSCKPTLKAASKGVQASWNRDGTNIFSDFPYLRRAQFTSVPYKHSSLLVPDTSLVSKWPILLAGHLVCNTTTPHTQNL